MRPIVEPTNKQRGRDADSATLPSFTYGEASRFHFFVRMMTKVAELDGDIVECGVGWGRSLIHLLSIMQAEEKIRNLWAFDSFEGFPEPTAEDASFRNPLKGEWKSDIRKIEAMLLEAGFSENFLRQRLIFVKGFFSDTLPSYRGAPIVFLHADADLYASYKDILANLYDRVVPGEVIVMDEYLNTWEHAKFPGARKAIDEFFEGKERIIRDEIYGKFYVIKGSS
jgi:hypothetical protein